MIGRHAILATPPSLLAQTGVSAGIASGCAVQLALGTGRRFHFVGLGIALE